MKFFVTAKPRNRHFSSLAGISKRFLMPKILELESFNEPNSIANKKFTNKKFRNNIFRINDFTQFLALEIVGCITVFNVPFLKLTNEKTVKRVAQNAQKIITQID